MSRIEDRVTFALSDPTITRQVVVAAAKALHAVEQGELTTDGDSSAMSARTILQSAFIDLQGLESLYTHEHRVRQ